MRHVFDQNGIKGAIAAVAKLPDNAVSILKMPCDILGCTCTSYFLAANGLTLFFTGSS